MNVLVYSLVPSPSSFVHREVHTQVVAHGAFFDSSPPPPPPPKKRTGDKAS